MLSKKGTLNPIVKRHTIKGVHVLRLSLGKEDEILKLKELEPVRNDINQ